MYTTSLRGLGMTQPPQIMVAVPQPAPDPPTQMPTAETSLANAAYQDANDYMQFVATSNAPNYANPAAYTANMIEYAKELCYPSWGPYVCPAGYDPTAMGTKYANVVFAALKATPYNGTNVYAWWVAHPIPGNYDTPPPQTPYNPANVPGSSVLPPPPNTLNNVAPPPSTPPVTNPTTVLNPPVQNWFPLNPNQIANGTTGSGSPFAIGPGLIGCPDGSCYQGQVSMGKMVAMGLVAALVILPMLGGKR